jgi:hypothetical protein
VFDGFVPDKWHFNLAANLCSVVGGQWSVVGVQ